MNYQINIVIKEHCKELLEGLKVEQDLRERSSFKVVEAPEGLRLEIKAKDATALRATVNAVCQMLQVFEGVIDDASSKRS